MRFLRSRRQLLKAAVPAVASGLARSAGTTIAVGVITEATAGHMGSYLKSLGTCEGISRVGIADSTGPQMFDKAKQLFGTRASTLSSYTDVREMLKAVQPTLTVVSMEAHHAAAPAALALEHGSHVLMEKPPCTRLEDFEELGRIARAKSRLLMLGMATRLHPVAIEARRLVREQYLGKLYGVTMNWIGDQTRLKNPVYQRSWVASRAKAGGGKLIFHGIHYLDLIEFITGDELQQVTAFTKNVGGQPIDVEDSAVVAMQFRKGAIGTLNCGYYLDKGYGNLIEIWGSEGWLKIEFPSKQPLRWYSKKPGAPEGIQAPALPDEVDEYGLMVCNAVNACRGAGEAFMTTEDSVRQIRAVFQAYRSAENGAAQRVSA